MKKSKTILAATLAATMLLSLVGCSDNDDSKSSKKDKNESSSAEIADINTAYTEPMGTEPEIVNSIITEPITEPETEPVTESDKFVPSASQQEKLDKKAAYALVDKDGKLVKYSEKEDFNTLYTYNNAIPVNPSILSDSISDTIVVECNDGDSRATIILESNVDTDFSKITEFSTYPDNEGLDYICKCTAMVTDEDEINKYKTKYNVDGDVAITRSYRYSDEKLKSILGEEAYNEGKYQAYNELPTDADYMITFIIDKESSEYFEKNIWGLNRYRDKYEERGLSHDEAESEYNYLLSSLYWWLY